MSDLYDSLEDERDEDTLSSDFLDRRKTYSSGSVRWDCKSHSTKKYSFFLNENVNKESQNLQTVFQFSNILSEKKISLPQIKNSSREEGPESVSNTNVDNKSLSVEGLQLNDDGSYSKSPRQEMEEPLPFITREYRNLQFQKKKTYRLRKKSPAVKKQKKNIFSFTNPNDGINMTQLITARKKKISSETMALSDRSLPGEESQAKSDKQLAANYNLTDSMKEKLMGTCSLKKQVEDFQSIKLKSKHEINIRKTLSQQNQIPTVGKKKENHAKSDHLSSKENFCKNSSDVVSDMKKSKYVPQKIVKYKSDILINGIKPKLNYSEQQQLKSGFNPLSLRHESKKDPSDTNRSNFGDSEMAELPEFSSRVMSCDYLGDEEEEMFYRKLMEKDKNRKLIQQSSSFEGRMEQLSLKSITDSHKGVRETMSGRNNSRSKHNSKSMFIDMPFEGDRSVIHLKKFSHYCSNHSSPNMSKVELTLKARTYGYLANARNIFKLKAQSEGKLSATERQKNQEIDENISTSPKKSSVFSPPTSGKLTKQNSLPVTGFPMVKTDFLRKNSNFPHRIRSTCKQPEMGSPTGFALPQVNNNMVDGKMNARLFERINYCLKGPNV